MHQIQKGKLDLITVKKIIDAAILTDGAIKTEDI